MFNTFAGHTLPTTEIQEMERIIIGIWWTTEPSNKQPKKKIINLYFKAFCIKKTIFTANNKIFPATA